jgi:TnsA endonuclease N terminal
MAYQGYFRPKNPAKYRGNPSNIIYRSRWELKLMMYLDEHKDVLSWGSEEVIIPYRSPIDGRVHRYFPDFIVTKINKDGKKETTIIEVKPAAQTKPPVKQAKPNKRYLTEVMTWGVNEAKWKAAQSFCDDRGWSFHIFTEKELGIKW